MEAVRDPDSRRDQTIERLILQYQTPLVRKMKENRMLPGHAVWTVEKPTETEMDAFAAEAFGIPGYPSAVNMAVIIRAVAGSEALWDWTTRSLIAYLTEKYRFHSDSIPEIMTEGSEEISAETAAEKIRTAVCEAWEMPEGSLKEWKCVTQLVQASVETQQGNMVFYRVFLTRPDGELGQDTFGGKDNFSYRILLDGTIIDSAMVSGWYSPAEDARR